ncbi:hypothetical protein GW17_00011132 [Ensete ventricosum]|uniref:Uncharacterized protein n=1 Tax=Ensete ventricosum TaxID=4639 RepID=A0A444FPN5_ENSVE|nr:hypothetical protein B296_00022263 [Ensete ventricosum]RWW24563.1 hypothetical protein GW17_00011132 [Ensete ventricosum]RZS02038.1 hypothetical protein BHM03_00032011 [Ensete ventricosum]
MARSGLRSASLLLRGGAKGRAGAPTKRSFSASAHDDACNISFISLSLVAILADETAKWEKITYAGIVTCTILATYNLSKGHPHSEEPPVFLQFSLHKPLAYPYLHIRNKEFPWGLFSLPFLILK